MKFAEFLFSDVGGISSRGGVGKVERGSFVVPRPVCTLNGDDESTMNLSSGTSENWGTANFAEFLFHAIG
jgi:hypothetical protein